jgi:hypothetical protein
MIERRRRFFVRALVAAGFKVAGRRWNDLFGLTAECNSAAGTQACGLCAKRAFCPLLFSCFAAE